MKLPTPIAFRRADGTRATGYTTAQCARMFVEAATGAEEPERTNARRRLVDLLAVPSFDRVQALLDVLGAEHVVDAAHAALDVRVDVVCGLDPRRPRRGN